MSRYNSSHDGANGTTLSSLSCADSYSWASKATVSVLHATTSAWLAAFAAFLWRKAELRHPVFAVVFQDVAVMVAANLASALALPVVLLAGEEEHFCLWIEVGSRAFASCMQFHQTAWLVLSVLRLYLARRADDDLDLPPGLLPRSLLSTWLLFATLSAVFYPGREALFAAAGLDSFSFSPVADSDSLRGLLYLLMLATVNLPDYASIALYLALYRRQQTAVGLVQPVPAGGEYHYLGPVQGGSKREARPDEAQEAHPHHPPPPPPSGPTNQEALCAMRALRTHSLTCLLDLFLVPFLGLLPRCEASLTFTYVCFLFLSYWIPVVSIVHNFGRLRSTLAEMFGRN